MAGTVRVDSVLTKDGRTVPGTLAAGDYHLGKLVMEYDSTSYTTSSSSFVLLKEWTNQTGFSPNSVLEFFYHVPTRKDNTGWGGLYFEPNVSFDGGTTYYSLGTCGYDGGIMALGTDMIHYYSNIFMIYPEQSSSYDFRLKLNFKVYSGTSVVNGNHDINGINTNTNYWVNGDSHLQHWMHYIVKEWIPA